MNYEDGIYLRKKLKERIAQYIDSQIPVKYHIYESCTFTVPYDTAARIIAVGKGGTWQQAMYMSSDPWVCGGGGGGTAVKLAKLKKGDKITITLNDEKTTAACKDWAVSGYNGENTYYDYDTNKNVYGLGGAAEGGGTKSVSTSSVIVGDDIQLIAGGGYWNPNNAISKQGSCYNSKDNSDNTINYQVYGGGASYHGGAGGYMERSPRDYFGGDGGDGLYGGGDGSSSEPRAINSAINVPWSVGGKGGDSTYGCGGRGGEVVGSVSSPTGESTGGDGGNGHILGGVAGRVDVQFSQEPESYGHLPGTPGQGGFLSAPLVKSILWYNGIAKEWEQINPPTSHTIYQNYPAQIPMIRPIGSGGGATYGRYCHGVGVGAVIIEFGITEFLKTY